MKDYIGHHTCSNSGGRAFVQENAPFLSKWEDPLPAQSHKNPFLGTGYYFWEFDIPQASRWGKSRYGNSFFILEGTIHTTSENFLDLTGDRNHMGFLLLSATKLIKRGLLESTYKLGELIETLKRIRETKPGVFPFSIIRSMDYRQLDSKKRVYFRNDDSHTYLDPSHIFCLLNKNELVLSHKRIIFPS